MGTVYEDFLRQLQMIGQSTGQFREGMTAMASGMKEQRKQSAAEELRAMMSQRPPGPLTAEEKPKVYALAQEADDSTLANQLAKDMVSGGHQGLPPATLKALSDRVGFDLPANAEAHDQIKLADLVYMTNEGGRRLTDAQMKAQKDFSKHMSGTFGKKFDAINRLSLIRDVDVDKMSAAELGIALTTMAKEIGRDAGAIAVAEQTKYVPATAMGSLEALGNWVSGNADAAASPQVKQAVKALLDKAYKNALAYNKEAASREIKGAYSAGRQRLFKDGKIDPTVSHWVSEFGLRAKVDKDGNMELEDPQGENLALNDPQREQMAKLADQLGEKKAAERFRSGKITKSHIENFKVHAAKKQGAIPTATAGQ